MPGGTTDLLDLPMPPDVATDLTQLRAALDSTVPTRQLDKNLLIATWNIRAFGDLTEKWHAEEEDTPKRDLHALICIAEIVSRFDVIGLQEVRGNIKCLRHLLKILGPHWGVMLTDVTGGKAGNDERMAFLFDTRRVKPSGLACELVVPVEDSSHLDPDAFNRQFARTPYAVSFLAEGMTFILVALHVLYGKQAADRIPELQAIAEWLAEWAKRVNDWNQNLIALGDFNIDRRGDPLFDAFFSTGLSAPKELNEVPRTIFEKPGEEGNFYDQIAWFTGEKGMPVLSLDYTDRAGGFDFVPLLIGDQTRNELSWRISDHYPLWAEFAVTRIAG